MNSSYICNERFGEMAPQFRLHTLLNKPCRFRLRSGKDIYGIIWEVNSKNGIRHYFTSASLQNKIETAENKVLALSNQGVEFDIDRVVLAELMA